MEKSRDKEYGRKKLLNTTVTFCAVMVPVWLNFYCRAPITTSSCNEDEKRELICVNDVDEPPQPRYSVPEDIFSQVQHSGTISNSMSTASGSTTTLTAR